MHGYLLAKIVAERSDGMLSLPEGTLYPLLHELEADRLVEATWDTSPAGRRRRIYRITPRGKRELGDWRTRWAALTQLVGAVLVAPRLATNRGK